MRTLVTALVSVGLLTGLAGAASAHSKKHRGQAKYYDNSQSAVAERQRHRRTFDETQYYERDSRKIPFGTPAWWRQKEFESGSRG
jgi:hypothetical protein